MTMYFPFFHLFHVLFGGNPGKWILLDEEGLFRLAGPRPGNMRLIAALLLAYRSNAAVDAEAWIGLVKWAALETLSLTSLITPPPMVLEGVHTSGRWQATDRGGDLDTLRTAVLAAHRRELAGWRSGDVDLITSVTQVLRDLRTEEVFSAAETLRLARAELRSREMEG